MGGATPEGEGTYDTVVGHLCFTAAMGRNTWRRERGHTA